MIVVMRHKRFVIINSIILLTSMSLLAYRYMGANNQPQPANVQVEDERSHIETYAKNYGGPEPPTSGPHSAPMPWQIYDNDIGDSNAIHNLEHGGIYVAYRYDLPAEQIERLKALFSVPSSRPGFSPTKVLVAPRSDNRSPIVVSSWKKNLKLDAFDEEKLVAYYTENLNKSPEAEQD